MKIGKAPAFLKKAVTLCKSKTTILTARFLVLASLRHRTATVGAISHRIVALVAATNREKCPRVDLHKALKMRMVKKTPLLHCGEIVVNLSRQLALLDQENEDDGGCPDWTLPPIFNDHDNNYRCYTDECEVEGGEDDADVLVGLCDEGGSSEPSVMDVIKNNREVEGLEFNIDDKIDQAADMFIARVRKKMSIGSF